MKLSGVSISVNHKIGSFPLFPSSVHFISVSSGKSVWVKWSPPPLWCRSHASFYSIFFIFAFVLSVNVVDGSLSPCKHHYSHFLCNVNDGDPLFISDLLITSQPIACPARQGSHSHSRHYFIKRVRLVWAFINNNIIMQVWCIHWLNSSGEVQDGIYCCVDRCKDRLINNSLILLLKCVERSCSG